MTHIKLIKIVFVHLLEPTYLPGSVEDVGACTGKNATATARPQDTNPASTPPTATTTPRINVALASNGGVVTASSTMYESNYPAMHPVASVIKGDRTGRKWGSGGGWNDATSGEFPDWLQIDLAARKALTRSTLSHSRMASDKQASQQRRQSLLNTGSKILWFSIGTVRIGQLSRAAGLPATIW